MVAQSLRGRLIAAAASHPSRKKGNEKHMSDPITVLARPAGGCSVLLISSSVEIPKGFVTAWF